MSGLRLLDRLRAWAALAPLVVLLAATYWLSQQVLPLPPAPNYKARHDPDVVITNFSATALGENGQPRYLLAASRMEHFPDDDSTYLTEPRLTSPYKDKPPIHISADSGTVLHNGDEIELHDHIVIVREAAGKLGELKVTTSSLRVLPDKQTAETERPVAITEDRGVTTARGLKLDSAARTLKLLSQVKADYAPARR